MHNSQIFKIYGILFLLSAGVMLFSVRAQADVRADYLINLLKTGSSYRVKIQAAQSLGRIQCKEAIPALQSALDDHSPHVVIAAAAALGEIGDPSVLPALKAASRKGHPAPVKTQLAATIRLLQSMDMQGNGLEIDGGVPSAQYLVKVDAMGNSSASRTPDIAGVMRGIVVQVLQKRSGIEIQAGSLTAADVKSKVKKENKKAFIVSGALIKLQQEQNFMVANIALNVLTNPDYNLVMMPSGEARVPIDFSAVQEARVRGASSDTIAQLERDAVRKSESIVMEKLIDNLIGKILEAAPDVL